MRVCRRWSSRHSSPIYLANGLRYCSSAAADWSAYQSPFRRICLARFSGEPQSRARRSAGISARAAGLAGLLPVSLNSSTCVFGSCAYAMNRMAGCAPPPIVFQYGPVARRDERIVVAPLDAAIGVLLQQPRARIPDRTNRHIAIYHQLLAFCPRAPVRENVWL